MPNLFWHLDIWATGMLAAGQYSTAWTYDIMIKLVQWTVERFPLRNLERYSRDLGRKKYKALRKYKKASVRKTRKKVNLLIRHSFHSHMLLLTWCSKHLPLPVLSIHTSLDHFIIKIFFSRLHTLVYSGTCLCVCNDVCGKAGRRDYEAISRFH